MELHSFFLIRINFIRISRLGFASNVLAMSGYIQLGIHSTT